MYGNRQNILKGLCPGGLGVCLSRQAYIYRRAVRSAVRYNICVVSLRPRVRIPAFDGVVKHDKGDHECTKSWPFFGQWEKSMCHSGERNESKTRAFLYAC